MVWFQCEVCGENLKKPKLPNHFRQCPSYKLSCIDCGQTFDKQSVQSHTQCITEAEKYGPKGQSNATPAKPNKEKPKLDVDINVGLSNRPPWFCGLCNTKATSKQALLLHADGKKHRAKVRAHTAKQKASEEAVPENKDVIVDNVKNEAPNSESAEVKKKGASTDGVSGHDSSLVQNGNLSEKKRKLDSATKKSPNGLDNDNTTLGDTKETPKKLKKIKCETELDNKETKEKRDVGKDGEKDEAGARKQSSKDVKWKKLILSALDTAPNGRLKMKKVRKIVLKELQDSGVAVDAEFGTILRDTVIATKKFTFDGKYVRLAAPRFRCG